MTKQGMSRDRMKPAEKGNSEMKEFLKKEFLDEITGLHRQFKKLYRAGVIAVNRDNIQVTEEFIQKMPGKAYGKNRRKGFSHPFSAHKLHEGLEYFALLKQPYEGGADGEQADAD